MANAHTKGGLRVGDRVVHVAHCSGQLEPGTVTYVEGADGKDCRGRDIVHAWVKYDSAAPGERDHHALEQYLVRLV
jgi:hypothetical protein